MSLELERYKAENEYRLAEWKAKVESDLAVWKVDNDISLKSLEFTIGFANITIRALMLANGGALVALLAFFGNTWKASPEIIPDIISKSIPSMNAFLLGLVFAILVGGFAYLAQHFFTNRKNDKGVCLQIIAIVFAVLSLGGFACGAWHMSSLFDKKPAAIVDAVKPRN